MCSSRNNETLYLSQFQLKKVDENNNPVYVEEASAIRAIKDLLASMMKQTGKSFESFYGTTATAAGDDEDSGEGKIVLAHREAFKALRQDYAKRLVRTPCMF